MHLLTLVNVCFRAFDIIIEQYLPVVFYTVPAGAPLNVSSTNVTSSSVRLQWDAPARRHRNGVIVLYEVMYRLKDNYIDDWTTNTSEPWIVIDGLEPAQEYQFQIRAYTGRGGGPWSDTHLVQTLSHSKYRSLSISQSINQSIISMSSAFIDMYSLSAVLCSSVMSDTKLYE